jgi:t-SNARE complex subunit (syntaxin)
MESTNYSSITDMRSFYAAVERLEAELRAYKEGVEQISALQDRTLGSIADSQVQNELDSIVEHTRQTAQRLRNGIKELQAIGSESREGQIRAKRVR